MIKNFSFLLTFTSFISLLSVEKAQSATTIMRHDPEMDKAIHLSLHPGNRGRTHKDEEADFQRALRESADEAEAKAEAARAQMLEEIRHKEAEELKKDLFFKHFIPLIKEKDFDREGNYIGTNEEIKKLFLKPDYETWQSAFRTYNIMGGEKPTGLNVVDYLEEVQKKMPSKEWILLTQHAELELITGCWGFRKEPATLEEEKTLKGVLRKIGRSHTTLSEDSFSQKIIETMTSKDFFKDPFFQAHYIEVLLHVNEGFSERHSPKKIHDLLDFQWALILSEGKDITSLAKSFSRVGYYVSGQVTVEQLVETALYRKPSFTIERSQAAKLQNYLSSWDSYSPHITENLDNLRFFVRLIAAQPFINIYGPQAIEEKILDKLDHLKDWADDDREILAEILFESLHQYDFESQDDEMYEEALESTYEKYEDINVLGDKVEIKRTFKEVITNGALKAIRDAAAKGEVIFNDAFVNLFPKLVNFVDDKSKFHQEVYVAAYNGKAYDPNLFASKDFLTRGLIQPTLTELDQVEVRLQGRKDAIKVVQKHIADLKETGLLDDDDDVKSSLRGITRLETQIKSIEDTTPALYENLETLGVTVELSQGNRLSDQVVGWLGQHANCPNLATIEYKSVPTGEDPTKEQYNLLKKDGSYNYPNLSRLLNYMSLKGYIDRSLILPIFLWFNNGMMID